MTRAALITTRAEFGKAQLRCTARTLRNKLIGDFELTRRTRALKRALWEFHDILL
jgi:hypothetical protein